MMNRYAPLFCNASPGRRQWAIHLIRDDAPGSVGLPAYCLQLA
jgi:hypothetical protein